MHRQPGLDGETPIWFVTRYDDVVALLTDNERFVVDPKLALTPERARGVRSCRLRHGRARVGEPPREGR